MLRCIVFSMTYKCPLECTYCGAQCSPRRTERLSYADMESIIDQVYAYGELQLVVFTGGEPLLFREDLIKAIRFCSERKLLTRVVTSAYWATNRANAQRVVSCLREAGLTEMNISCDDYHQKFVPLKRVAFAHQACLEEGLPALIAHKVMKGHTISLETLDALFGRRLARFDPSKKNPDHYVVLSSFTVPIDDQMHLIPDEEILYPECPDWHGPCVSALQRIIITPLKELSVCCGMIPRKVQEILFGTLDEHPLEQLVLDAQNDLIVNWLALEGPYQIMKFIQKKAPQIQFREKYVNICHLCSEILIREDCRAVLQAHAHERATELSLKQTVYNAMRSLDINDDCPVPEWTSVV